MKVQKTFSDKTLYSLMFRRAPSVAPSFLVRNDHDAYIAKLIQEWHLMASIMPKHDFGAKSKKSWYNADYDQWFVKHHKRMSKIELLINNYRHKNWYWEYLILSN